MNVKIKATWLKALRSGKYKQTRGKMKSRNGSFCCLGVLCEIQGAEWNWRGDKYVTLGCSLAPPDEYSAEISEQGLLASMNDGSEGHKKHSFAEIADYIEANL